MKTKNPDDDFDNERADAEEEVREFVEQLPGYQEHIREQRGDSLNFGDM
jgi:hypothetical protein